MSPELSRRSVLAGAAGVVGAAGVGAACRRRPPEPVRGRLLGHERAALGHRVRGAAPLPQGPPTTADVVIVGAGVAGLSAAWRLARAGFAGQVVLLDLGAAPGGTAAAGSGPGGPYPLGAHYPTLPGPDCLHVRAMLADFGVITGTEQGELLAGGRPHYDPLALCLAPQERLYVAGEWTEGLWPELLASPEAVAQRRAFDALVASWSARRGRDGRFAFDIPVALCSRDPELRALARPTFAAWLDAQGLTDPVLRWWIAYATLDDYGVPPEACSAWAGLHYFCSRRPDPADATDLGTHVLTWPEGNGWLVTRLLERARVQHVAPAVAVRVEPDTGTVWYLHDDDLRGVQAQAVVLAVPARVVDRLLTRPAGLRPDLAPWRVAQLHVDRLPAGHGVPTAWDSVVYEGEGLGYVTSSHQGGRFAGPAVLTWYQPLAQAPPAEGRQALLDATWEAEAAHVLAALGPSHPDLREVLVQLDVVHWGHGTAIPAPGLHAGDALALAAAPVGRVELAHSDLSGLSLFEEASWHGVRAAESVLARLGQDDGERLAQVPA